MSLSTVCGRCSQQLLIPVPPGTAPGSVLQVPCPRCQTMLQAIMPSQAGPPSGPMYSPPPQQAPWTPPMNNGAPPPQSPPMGYPVSQPQTGYPVQNAPSQQQVWAPGPPGPPPSAPIGYPVNNNDDSDSVDVGLQPASKKLTKSEKKRRKAAEFDSFDPALPPPLDPSVLANSKAEKQLTKKMKWGEKKKFKKLAPNDKLLYLGIREAGLHKWLPEKARFEYVTTYTHDQRKLLFKFRQTEPSLNGKEIHELVMLTDDERSSFLGIKKLSGSFYSAYGDVLFFFMISFHWISIAIILGIYGPQATAEDFPIAAHLIYGALLAVQVALEVCWVWFFLYDGRGWMKREGWWLLKYVGMSLLARFDSYTNVSFFIIALKADWEFWGVALGFTILAIFFSCLFGWTLSMPVVQCQRCERTTGGNPLKSVKTQSGFQEEFSWLALNICAFQLLGTELFAVWAVTGIKDAMKRPDSSHKTGHIYVVPPCLASGLSSVNVFDNFEPLIRGMFEDIPQFIIQTAFLAWSTSKSGWKPIDYFTLISSIISFVYGLLICGSSFRKLTSEPRWAKKPEKSLNRQQKSSNGPSIASAVWNADWFA